MYSVYPIIRVYAPLDIWDSVWGDIGYSDPLRSSDVGVGLGTSICWISDPPEISRDWDIGSEILC